MDEFAQFGGHPADAVPAAADTAGDEFAQFGGHSDAAAPEAENPHDLLPALKSAGAGLVGAVGHAVAHPIDTAKGVASDAWSAAKGWGKDVRDMVTDFATGAPVPGGFSQRSNPVPDKDQQAAVAAASVVPQNAPIAIAHTYIQSKAAGNSDEDALKDARNIAAILGLGQGAGMATKAAMPALGWTGKKAARAFADVPEQAVENYIENPAGVNAAKPLFEKTQEFLGHAKDVGKELSGDSGKSFEMLKAAGGATPEVFVQPLQEAAEHIKSLGAFGAERKSAVSYLGTLSEDIGADATANGGTLSLDKGKSLLQVLDAKIEQTVNSGGDAQILKSLKNARRTIDTYLKTNVPEYGAHMGELAGDTKALTGLTDKFSSDSGAMNALKRVQQGRDPFTAEALGRFDERFGSTHAEDLKNAWTQAQFTKDTTNGARKAAIGGFAGNAVGGPVGGGIGSVLGAIQDKYGGRIVKTALDAGIAVDKIANTKYIAPIMEAAKRGPQAVAVAHQMLMQRDKDYAAIHSGDGLQAAQAEYKAQ